MARITDEYALKKTRECFESLTWDSLNDSASLAGQQGAKVAVVLNELGSVLEEEMDLSPETYARMLICAGCAILAARSNSQEVAKNN